MSDVPRVRIDLDLGDDPSRREMEIMAFVSDDNITQALRGCLQSFRGSEEVVGNFFAHMTAVDWFYLRLQVVRSRNFEATFLNRIFVSFVSSKVAEIKASNDGGADDIGVRKRLRTGRENTRKQIRRFTHS